MKERPDDEPRDEYDFREGVQLAEEGLLVRLDPDVATQSPTVTTNDP